jgi:hypothetical protein
MLLKSIPAKPDKGFYTALHNKVNDYFAVQNMLLNLGDWLKKL